MGVIIIAAIVQLGSGTARKAAKSTILRTRRTLQTNNSFLTLVNSPGTVCCRTRGRHPVTSPPGTLVIAGPVSEGRQTLRIENITRG